MGKEHLLEFINRYLKPTILEEWKWIAWKPEMLFDIFHQLHDYEWYDEICEKILETFKTRTNYKKLAWQLDIYHRLKKIHESGNFYRDLSEDVQFFEDRINNHPHYSLTFNLENRLVTFEELKAKGAGFEVGDLQYKGNYKANRNIDEKIIQQSEQERLKLEEVENAKKRNEDFEQIVDYKFNQYKVGEFNIDQFEAGEEASIETEDYVSDDDEGEEDTNQTLNQREAAKIAKAKLKAAKMAKKKGKKGKFDEEEE